MGFITNLTAAIPTTGEYVNGLPSGVDNRHGNIRDGGTISDSVNWSSSALAKAILLPLSYLVLAVLYLQIKPH